MGSNCTFKLPTHDVSIMFEGPATHHAVSFFQLLWNNPNQQDEKHKIDKIMVPASGVTSELHGATAVQLVRTLPWKMFDNEPRGERGVLEAYQRAILYAEEFVYIEAQYFTEPQIVESLIAALQFKPKLQLILLVNNYVDTRYYHKLQNDAIQDLLRKAKDIDAHLRVGVFTAWVLYRLPCSPG